MMDVSENMNMIIKRDGSTEEFDKGKIVAAIEKACLETEYENDIDDIKQIAEEIAEENELHFNLQGRWLSVENVNDLCESKMMAHGMYAEAKRFIIYRSEQYKKRHKEWDMTDLQRDVLYRKYIHEGEDFDGFIRRVGNNEPKLMKAIRDRKFLFAGRILDGRGSEYSKTYSSCFVLPTPEDNLESIFDVGKKMARTYALAGGCGVSLEKLRPNGAITHNSANKSTGSVSFGGLYSFITGLIGQSNRRGALMLSLPISHPDINEFITVKSDLDKLTKANISIMITDDFMKAVQNSDNYKTSFTVVHDNGEEEIIERIYNARELFDILAEQNHEFAEPGVLWWSRINNWYLLSEDGDYNYDSTNPCAEKPLPANSNCLLSSINLSELVKNQFGNNAYFDFEEFADLVDLGVVQLNKVLDEGIDRLPFEENKEFSRNYRPIGLGYLGYGDMLVKLGLKYGSEEALELTHKIGDLMIKQALKTSALLAKENGAFPKFKLKEVLESPFFKEHTNDEITKLVKEYGLYNAELLSIAPTGSLSLLAGTSSGIEPIYKISYIRKTESISEDGDAYYKVFTPIAREYMDKFGITKEEDLPDYFITSGDLTPLERIKTQSVWQHYVDASISSTVNLHESATVEDVKDVYSLAWEYGLKGVTVFRDGCKRAGILGNHDSNKDKKSVKDMSVEDLQLQLSMKLEQEFVKNPDVCPKCGGELKRENGCEQCLDCGWSPCSI